MVPRPLRRRVDTLRRLCYNRCVMAPETNEPHKKPVHGVHVFGITGIGEIEPGDDLGAMLADAAQRQQTAIEPGDILVVTQKIVSKAEGRVVDLSDVEPSTYASNLASWTGKDPRLVELVLRESRTVVRVEPEHGIIITETHHGFVCANAGIDTSNVPGDGKVALLPQDPDGSARLIRAQVRAATSGVEAAVIISDTFGRAWREGHVNFAIGVAGMGPIKDYRGTPDAYGMILKVTNIAVADELAAAAELVTGKSIGVPAAIVKGYEAPPGDGSVGDLLRDRSRDLFR